MVRRARKGKVQQRLKREKGKGKGKSIGERRRVEEPYRKRRNEKKRKKRHKEEKYRRNEKLVKRCSSGAYFSIFGCTANSSRVC